jgi:hypothetical protein
MKSRIVGRLVDQSKPATPGVTVSASSKQTGAVRTAVTGEGGTYGITNLAPGRYAVAYELTGFATHSRDVLLGLVQIETLDITLGVATVQEAVTFSARRR